jgi:YesN/AraC family two-component response regulator
VECELPKSILIVDDEQVMREFLSDVLEEFDIVKASDGEEAIRFIGEKEFDLIITDMKMPGISGEEVVEFAKKNCPEVGIIVISGYSSLASVSKTLDYGVNAFLSKPFTIKQLRSEVTRALEDKNENKKGKTNCSEIANEI